MLAERRAAPARPSAAPAGVAEEPAVPA
jgi:hypothetical protein